MTKSSMLAQSNQIVETHAAFRHAKSDRPRRVAAFTFRNHLFAQPRARSVVLPRAMLSGRLAARFQCVWQAVAVVRATLRHQPFGQRPIAFESLGLKVRPVFPTNVGPFIPV